MPYKDLLPVSRKLTVKQPELEIENDQKTEAYVTSSDVKFSLWTTFTELTIYFNYRTAYGTQHSQWPVIRIQCVHFVCHVVHA